MDKDAGQSFSSFRKKMKIEAAVISFIDKRNFGCMYKFLVTPKDQVTATMDP